MSCFFNKLYQGSSSIFYKQHINERLYIRSFIFPSQDIYLDIDIVVDEINRRFNHDGYEIYIEPINGKVEKYDKSNKKK